MKALLGWLIYTLCLLQVPCIHAYDRVSSETLEEVKALLEVVTRIESLKDLDTPEKGQKYIMASRRIKELGDDVDKALFILFFEQDYRFKWPGLFDDYIGEARPLVPQTLPFMRKIVTDSFEKENQASMSSDVSSAINYLSWWGDESDLALLQKWQAKYNDQYSRGKDIQSFPERKAMRERGELFPWEKQRPDWHFRRRLLPEFTPDNGMPAEVRAEIEAQHSSPKVKPKQSITPIPATQSAPVPKDESPSWLVWLLVVIVATVGAAWVFLRKSK